MCYLAKLSDFIFCLQMLMSAWLEDMTAQTYAQTQLDLSSVRVDLDIPELETPVQVRQCLVIARAHWSDSIELNARTE